MYWSQLLLNLAEGRPEGVAVLERMPSVEFYYLYKAAKLRNQEIADSYKH
ncbi:hypothetical protein GCM10028808_74690 [Spirosoma migulaei]